MMQGPSRTDIWLARLLWIVTTLGFALMFWHGLTDGRASGTWRALGFAYAAIFLISNAFLYGAKNPDQTRRKLGSFMIALSLGPLVLLAADNHAGDTLFWAMIWSPLMVMNNATLNPRFLEQLPATRRANPAPFVWKTALRQFAGALVLSFLLVIIVRVCKSGNLDLSLRVWIEVLLLTLPVCLSIMIIALLLGSRANTRQAMGREERTRDDAGT
jgi:hypothetical protein